MEYEGGGLGAKGFLRPIGGLWVLLSAAVGTSSVFAVGQPLWLRRASGEGGALWLGLWSFCRAEWGSSAVPTSCALYSSEEVGLAWWLGGGLVGLSSLLLFLSALLTFPTAFVSAPTFRRLMPPIQRLQAVALGLGAVGMLTLVAVPGTGAWAGCGGEWGGSVGRGSECRVGWAMALWSVASLLGLFCPFLAPLATFPLDDSALLPQPPLTTTTPPSQTPLHKEFFI